MYSARIDGEPTSFGTSGLLYRSNKVMYDRTTQTLWSQILGEPIIGPLADSGIKLSFFPVSMTTWGEWRADHPEATVLSLETGVYSASQYQPEDDAASIYYDYRADPETMFPVWDRDDRLDVKEEVLGVSANGAHKAYSIADLKRARTINDTIQGVNVLVVGSADSADARVYRRDHHRFGLAPLDIARGLPGELVDAEGASWTVTSEALVNTNDPAETLPRLQSNVFFWFGWYAFHPETEVYEVPAP